MATTTVCWSMSLGDDLKSLLDKEGVTAYEVEQKTGLSRSMLSRFFTGKIALSIKSLSLVLDYLGYELSFRKKKHGTK
jgi:transcriptional regulator with XRE-family HTH domain